MLTESENLDSRCARAAHALYILHGFS